MLDRLKKIYRGYTKREENKVNKMDHRAYVGGMWKEIGKIQTDFLKQEGMQRDDCLLDIGCGSLRGGVHMIEYLNKGMYIGMEKEEKLIEDGVKKELGMDKFEEKRPQLIVSSKFHFWRCLRTPTYAIAQSLFTHLPPRMIKECLSELEKKMDEGGKFYATFNRVEKRLNNPNYPDDHHPFEYTLEQMKKFGNKNGWNPEYIGNWNHPRDQKMIMYVTT